VSKNKVGLVEAIHALREELRDAQDSAPEDLKFTVQDIEVAFEVVTEKTTEASAGGAGKIRFWLFDADVKAEAKGGYSKSNSHSVKLTLKPLDYRKSESGDDIEINRKVDSPRRK